MNEQIKQLAEQVGAVQNVLAMGRHDGVLFTETELERFAELIVKEYAEKQVLASMSNSAYARAMDALYEKKWAHRFD